MCYNVLYQTSLKTHESCIFCTLSFDEKILDHCKINGISHSVFLKIVKYIIYIINCLNLCIRVDEP